MADLRSSRITDLDTGAGTDYVLGVNLRLAASGGSIDAVGQKTMAVSLPVTIASDQSALSVTLSSNVVDTELPAAAALADGAANPTTPTVGGALLGYNGTTWDRIYTRANADAYASGTKGFLVLGQNGTTDYRGLSVNSSGRLQVDVTSGGGEVVPTTPINDYFTSAALASNAVATLSTGEIGGNKLAGLEVWCSAAFKVHLFTVDNAVESTNPIAVGGGQAFQTFLYRPAHRNYHTLGSTAGLDAFRIKVTNLDNANPADVFAVFHYQAN